MLLDIRNLKVSFLTDKRLYTAVNNVSFNVNPGETLGVVGESGCGKSVTSLSVMGLVPNPPGIIENGEILFEGEDLLKKSEAQINRIRGNEIAMIFQEPMTSLNPVYTVGNQIAEVFQAHQNLSKKEAKEKAVEMLRLVGIPAPEKRVNDYPHQLSGGMRQRVMIAMALSCRPKLLIADEPTTALDVTIQAQILGLMKKLKKEFGMAIMMITHDLGVVAEMCDRVIVMYSGRIMEQADVRTIFKNPLHPYTEGLINSIPRLDQHKTRLNVIEGTVPNPSEKLMGCSFHPRCPYATDICRECEPELKELFPGHKAACWSPLGIKEVSACDTRTTS